MTGEAVTAGEAVVKFAIAPEQECPAFTLRCARRVVLALAHRRASKGARGKQRCSRQGWRNGLYGRFHEPFHLQLPCLGCRCGSDGDVTEAEFAAGRQFLAVVRQGPWSLPWPGRADV